MPDDHRRQSKAVLILPPSFLHAGKAAWREHYDWCRSLAVLLCRYYKFISDLILQSGRTAHWTSVLLGPAIYWGLRSKLPSNGHTTVDGTRPRNFLPYDDTRLGKEIINKCVS